MNRRELFMTGAAAALMPAVARAWPPTGVDLATGSDTIAMVTYGRQSGKTEAMRSWLLAQPDPSYTRWKQEYLAIWDQPDARPQP